MGQNTRKVVKISKRKMKFAVIIIVITLGAWFGKSFFTRISQPGIGTYSKNSFGTMPNVPDLSIARPENVNISSALKGMPAIFRKDQQVSINDTREFLKTNYSANIRTRDVQGVVSSAKNIVKGNDGRVDNISSSQMSGYLTFVVPKSKFETFRKEIEGLTYKKLFSETSSSQNLLSQKQRIEEQTNNINMALESLKQQKESLLSAHSLTLASINKELQSIRAELKVIRRKIEETTDSDVLSSLRSQENTYVIREAAQKQKLTTENSNYLAQNTNLDNQIKNQNADLVNVNTQDTKFTENIETVNGSIDVSWISIWQMIKVFSPIPLEIIIIVLVLIIWNILARLGYVPKFILE